MRKKLISALLAMCMVLALLPASALAATAPSTSGSCGDTAQWSYDASTKTLTISGSGEISYFDDLSFENRTLVEKVDFKGKITSIADLAFHGFENLSSIVLPDGLIQLGFDAFRDCTQLAHVVVPGSVTEVNLSSWNCPLLTSAGPLGSGCAIEFDWTDIIPAYAFDGCFQLTKVTLPETIKTIGESAFRGCSSLNEITIPKDVIRINYGAFDLCSNLENIFVDANNKFYSSQNGALLNKAKTTLIRCPEGKDTFIIPKNVTSIDSRAFYYCTKITKMVVPDSVVSVDYDSFYGCSSLTDLSLPGTEKYYGDSSGQGNSIPNLIVARISEGTEVLQWTFHDCSKLTTVYLPSTLSAIEADTFANCLSLQNIYFAGTEEQWNTIEKSGNPELDLAKITFNSTSTPTTPTDPDTPTTPGNLILTKSTGGLGTKVTTQVTGGHWLTVQVSRAGAISITAIQAPGSGGMVSVSFSAPAGSAVQVSETENELTFTDSVPNGVILNTASIEL